MQSKYRVVFIMDCCDLVIFAIDCRVSRIVSQLFTYDVVGFELVNNISECVFILKWPVVAVILSQSKN